MTPAFLPRATARLRSTWSANFVAKSNAIPVLTQLRLSRGQ
jgi:hypothetical protein